MVINCIKHNRLIIATLNVDTPEEKQYCIDCIGELENFKFRFLKITERINQLWSEYNGTK